MQTHWLWQDQDYISFDYADAYARITDFVEYVPNVQFEPEIMRLAHLAANTAPVPAAQLSTIATTADTLVAAETAWGHTVHGQLVHLYVGVTLGLCGRADEAWAMFLSINDEHNLPRMDLLEPFSAGPVAFRHRAHELVAAKRQILRLPALGHDPF
ncbi:hypothetical protein MSKU9_0618 [Komagataeibacter diospyri]|uniref:Uncharacterized protein n=1 Tax=Komagataeibacter diospyri TaxID=1932662 RepID=A0A4P5NPV1_9PROT|nr:hypothetical protein MSKU9_0618 [Komagataeibacter diospyri]